MRIFNALLFVIIYCSVSSVFGASYFLPSGIGSGPFSSCSGSGPSYTCNNNISIGNNDDLTLTADVTLVINGNLDIGNDFQVIPAGNTLTLDVNGNVDFGNNVDFSGNISTTGNVDIGNSASFTGDIVANGNVDIGNNGGFNGDITSNGNLDIGNNTTVAGSCSPNHPNCTGGGGGGGGSVCDTYRDNFSSTSYSNQDGTVNWLADWVESNDNGLPDSGDIRIQGGRLRLKDNNVSISRTTDLSAYTSATLSFDFQENGFDNNNDAVDIEIRGGGNGWQSLQSFVGSSVNTGSASLSIPVSFIANDFELRFITSNTTGNNDRFFVDNLELEACIPGVTTCNVADNFDNVAYNQNDGSDNWSGDWLEVGESDGPSAGIARVRNDNCTSGNCLRLGVPSGGIAQTYSGIGVMREADLTGVSSATLNFNFYTGYGSGVASVRLWASSNGGTSWNLIQQYNINSTSFVATAQSIDISTYIAANTQIRFTADGTSAVTGFYIDDLTIDYLCKVLPVGEWRLDETSWSGVAGEVLDSSGNGLHGRSIGGGTPNPAQVCNGATLSGGNQYVEVADNPLLDIPDELTVTAWINSNDYPTGGNLKSIVSKDENFEFHIDSSGQLNWWWGGGAQELTTTGAPIALGNWQHIAIVYSDSANSASIYIDGVLRANKTISGALTLNNDPFQIGGDQGFGGRYFNGQIDEVRVYNDALTAAQVNTVMNETRPCPVSGPDHYSISHSGTGIICEAQTVTVTAHNADHSPYIATSNISVTVTSNPLVDAITSSPVTILTGQSSADFTITQTSATTAPHIDINVTDGSASETSGSASAAIDDPALQFVDSLMQFVTDTSIPPGSIINTQIGGKPSSSAPNAQPLYLRAVRTDDTTGSPVCVAALDAGTHNIEMGYQCIDTANCSNNELGVTNNLVYNSGSATIIAHNDGATTANTLPVTLDFDAGGYAALSFQYDNVGEIALFANDYTTTSGGVIAGGVSDRFIVRPFALLLDFDNGSGAYNMRDLDWNDGNLDGSSSNNSYSDPTSNPQNSSLFQTAGTDFPAEISAVLWQATDDGNNDGEPDSGANLFNNDLASLFGQESSRSIQITHSLEQPAGANAGVLTSNFANPYANGRTEGTMNWNEVGIIDIQLALNAYLGDTTYTPISVAQDVGRFLPANFRLQAGSVTQGTFLSSCGIFTYIGQDFGYDTYPAFIVEAINGASNLTTNYRGVWNKLTPASFPVSTVSSDAGNSLDILHTQDTIDYMATGNGVFNVAFGDDSFCYGVDVAGACVKQANAQIAPFSADITMTLGTISDGEVSSVINQDFSPTLAELRYGRLALDNVFGSELTTLQMPMYTEFFDGNNFVVNTADNCTTIDHTILNELGVVAEPAVISSVVTVNSITANMGALNVDLTSPGANNTGSIDVTPDLDISTETWLKYDWDASLASPGLENPTGRATFGIYEGNDVNIYIQQIYQ